MLKDAAGHTMEELTGVRRQETCCVEKALKNGSEEACVKCREQPGISSWQSTTEAALGCCTQSPGDCDSNVLAGTWSCPQGKPGTLLGRRLRGRVPGAGARNVPWAEAQECPVGRGLGDLGRGTLGKAPSLLCLSLPVARVTVLPSPTPSQPLRAQTLCGRHCSLHRSSIPMASKVLLILDGISKMEFTEK